MCISLSTLVDILSLAQPLKQGNLSLYRNKKAISCSYGELLLFLFFLFFYVELERGNEAYLGKAEACCGVEHVRRHKEFRRQCRRDVGRTELVILAQTWASCVIHDPVPSGSYGCYLITILMMFSPTRPNC